MLVCCGVGEFSFIFTNYDFTNTPARHGLPNETDRHYVTLIDNQKEAFQYFQYFHFSSSMSYFFLSLISLHLMLF